MEEFGDWFYLIIIIIAGISSLIGSIGKKNKRAEEHRPAREVVAEEWVDWEEHGDRDVPQPVSAGRQADTRETGGKATFPRKHQADVPAQQRTFAYRSADAKSDNRYSIFKKDATDTPPQIDDDAAPITAANLPSNTDEWRKAFIYHEIFQRKA